MVIQCPSCQTRYHYADERFAGAPAKKIRCSKCATVFEIRNPALSVAPGTYEADETGPLNSPILGSDDFSLDTTMMGRGPRPRPASAARAASPGTAAPAGAPSPGFVPPPIPPAYQTGAPPSRPVPRGADKTPIPSELSRAGRAETNPAIRPLKLPDHERLSLACIAGPDAGRIFEVDRPRLVIGRNNADILLSDAECSRQHAVLEVSDDRVMVIDLGSTNGTYFNERRVGQIQLENRSEFDIGATTLMLIRTRKD